MPSIPYLDRALELLRDDEDGTYLGGNGPELTAKLLVLTHRGESSRLKPSVRSQFEITQDLWNLATIVERLAWTRDQLSSDESHSIRWSSYAALDIEHFHVEVRSLLDSVARSIRPFFEKPGTVPESFKKMLEWVKQNPNRNPATLATLLLEQESWFLEMRRVRDALVHSGAQTIVFGKPEEGILFQVVGSGSLSRAISGHALMFNENVAYFDRYAALCMARVICFLEDVSRIAAHLVGAPQGEPTARSYAPGFKILRDWISNLRTRLDQMGDP